VPDPFASDGDRLVDYYQKIGRLDNQDMARLGIALAFVLGLAD
jgi:hypothetical protein